MKKIARKQILRLDRETVRSLTGREFDRVCGGKFTQDDTCDICDPSIARVCSK